jgi:hypothetical protein
MAFIIGQTYTRQQICEEVGGGSVHDYLPNKDGTVLCACLSQEYGADIPAVILVGQGPGVQQQAEMFFRQAAAVPLFYKKMANQWEYAGYFKPVRSSDDPQEIAEFAEASGRRSLTRLIFLEAVLR